MMGTVGAWRAIWLLSCLRLQRLANLLFTMRFRHKAGTPVRAATPARRRGGAILSVLIMAMMSFSFVNIGRVSVLSMECRLAPGQVCAKAAAQPGQGPDENALAASALEREGYSAPVVRALALQLTVLLVASFILPLGSKELASADWDLEWLVTLPVRRRVLLAARIVERSVANPTGLMAIMAPSVVVAWYAGYRWSALPFALGAAALLLPIAAVFRTIADTGLRMSLPASQLRNLQAVCGVLSLPLLYFSMAFGTPSTAAFMAHLAAGTPDWILWTPAGLVIQVITAADPLQAAQALGLLLAELAACVVLGLAILTRQLRDGVAGAGVRESVRRSGRHTPAAAAPVKAWHTLLPRSPIQRRELRLLSRDRNFLVQSILMPVVIVGSQMIANGSLQEMSATGISAVALGVIAFGVSAYMLLMSAFQTINSEGQVLWLLYTFPTTLEQVLKEKAKLWAVLALVYPAILFGAGLAIAGHLDWHMVGIAVQVLAGIPLYSAIAVALGVFASDPLSQDARTRIKHSYFYLYTLLSGLYAYGIYAHAWRESLVVLVLTVGVGQAFWQKARDALPYLLDPVAAPPARVSTADGMIAVLLFFVLQALGGFFMARVLDVDAGAAVLLAFSLAGAIVYLLARLVYWRTGTTGVPVLRGGGIAATLRLGGGAGICAAVFGVGHLAILQLTSWGQDALRSSSGLHIGPGWLFPLAVVAAPLCEEFIFRGLIFGGLRRSMAFLPAAALSAGLFAIVHPPAAIIPVFVLGLCTAFAYERGKGLLAPMLTHAIYNAAVLTFPLLYTFVGTR
jgi:membrane protease YdiL (CAAX protease family)